MQTFLAVFAGVALGVGLVVGLAFSWASWRLSGACGAIASLAEAGGLAPFRITLERRDTIDWASPGAVADATWGFETAGYERAGDFGVPEMEALRLRAFWHPGDRTYGVIYDHDRAGVFADAVRFLEDGTRFTVSCAPETGLDRPPRAPLVRLDLEIREPDAARRLHERLVDETAERAPRADRAEDLSRTFSEAYAREMDWRIQRGGVTRLELKRIASLMGMQPPTARAYEIIESIWAAAINEFIQDEVVLAWLGSGSISAIDWERQRERVVVVHDFGDPGPRIDDLAGCLVEERIDEDDDEAWEQAHAIALEELRPFFDRGSIRECFAEAQVLLDEKHRYERIARVEAPWPADVYLAPESKAA